MKKSVRISMSLAIATSAALALTACDPPMPPDVAAQIAEQTYTCVEGDVTFAAPAEFADPLSQWQMSAPTSCVSPLPEMTITPTLDSSADVVVSSTAPSSAVCKPFETVPLAIESATIVFNLSVSSTLNLTPKTAAAILNGEITNWNDKAIVSENIGTELPDQPIIMQKPVAKAAFDSLNSWFRRLGSKIDKLTMPLADAPLAEDYSALAEGEIAIVPGSYAMSLGLFTVSVQTGIDPKTKEPLLALPDVSGTGSAATQWEAKESGNSVVVSLNPDLAPVAQAGFDDAAVPYQAIYPLNMYLCGEDTLLKRAAAVFVLRLDSQGALGASNYNQLSEGARTLALVTVRKGLPEPEAPKD